VLVVDDSADSREMLVEYLTFRRFAVSHAQNGEEALALARRVKPQIVLMDLSMPRVDGWECTRRLRADAHTRDAIIVAVTAHVFNAERRAAREAGCDAIVAKPYDLSELADALARVPSHGAKAFDTIASSSMRRARPIRTGKDRRG
jgi:two-component system cell cycle response regulator DivK